MAYRKRENPPKIFSLTAIAGGILALVSLQHHSDWLFVLGIIINFVSLSVQLPYFL